MEKLEIIVGKNTRNRIERIKKLRKRDLADQEIIDTAIAAYWMILENRERNKEGA